MTNSQLPKRAELSRDELVKGSIRLHKVVVELQNFDMGEVQERYDPKVEALEHRVKDAIEKTFPVESIQYNRFIHAGDIHPMLSSYGGRPPQLSDYTDGLKQSLPHSISTLESAVKSIEGELEELDEFEDNDEHKTPKGRRESRPTSRKIFIVHGHDDGAREKVARFVSSFDYQPVILHEQASSGKTVIEKIESNSDVDFAIVLLTADDVGGTDSASLQPRARQNVILELGYFIAHLKRTHVVALKGQGVELPSDFGGVVYVPLDGGDAWKISLAKEMKSAGLDIDMNKAIGL